MIVRVNVFRGVQHIAIYAARARGLFAAEGLEIELQYTRDSDAQRDGLARGAFEVAHAAVDNAVAIVEMGADVVIVLGGDSSMNQVMAQPDVGSIAELRGRTVIVDAPNTAYALQLRKVLLAHGLVAGRDYTVQPVGGTDRRLQSMLATRAHAATMLYPPYSVLAARRGLRSLGRAADLLGPYQATGAFVRREWAHDESDVLDRYLVAYLRGLRWALDPANEHAVIDLVARELDVTPDVAAASWVEARVPTSGLAPDARLDLAGFRAVLALRAELEGQWDGRPPDPQRYYDPGWYQRALARVDADG